jgi:hypothetical protein
VKKNPQFSRVYKQHRILWKKISKCLQSGNVCINDTANVYILVHVEIRKWIMKWRNLFPQAWMIMYGFWNPIFRRTFVELRQYIVVFIIFTTLTPNPMALMDCETLKNACNIYSWTCILPIQKLILSRTVLLGNTGWLYDYMLLQSQPHCDNDSETSLESNTSDSGRGGSESDIHSSGGLSQCQELGQNQFQIIQINPFVW